MDSFFNFWAGNADIDRKRLIERVLVTCSTDGRLHVYYDESDKYKEYKFAQWKQIY